MRLVVALAALIVASPAVARSERFCLPRPEDAGRRLIGESVCGPTYGATRPPEVRRVEPLRRREQVIGGYPRLRPEGGGRGRFEPLLRQ
jgi:hypothetical protein